MNQLSEEKLPDYNESSNKDAKEPTMDIVHLGLDDGYACTKIALADGRLLSIPSRARIGHAWVTWIRDGEQRIFEYETEGSVYSVGAVDGEPTHFEGYTTSAMNRVIVQHAFQQAGLSGRSLHVVSGLPVSAFYNHNGNRRASAINQKIRSLKIDTRCLGELSAPLSACVAFHDVIPEALAAWYDYVIVTNETGTSLDQKRVSAPIAIVDIGGRTTDYVVVQDQGVVHGSSGSLDRGLLNVKTQVTNSIQDAFDLTSISELRISAALETETIRLHGKDHDVSELIHIARQELVERLYSETRRLLGQGAELEHILFVGGGSAALAADIASWFPNQLIAAHPAFANARGMLKYLQFVSDETESS